MKLRRSHSVLIALAAITLIMQASFSGAMDRVVLLNPAVSSIIHQLDSGAKVVGVTYNDEIFSDQTRVGSHLSPSIELIKALSPDLIIAGSKRAFSNELAGRFQAELFRYDPQNLDEILAAVAALGRLFNKPEEARQIIRRESEKLATVKRIAQPVPVIFEISQRPLKVAGQQNVVSAIIAAAGGVNLIDLDQKHVLLSPETVLVANPAIYIYQNGPMNKNPLYPLERNYFKTLKSRVLEVDQLRFTRPGLNVFDAVLYLNERFAEIPAD